MSYKTEFQANNADLQSILDQVNALPEAGAETCAVTVTGAYFGTTGGVVYTAYENGEFVAKAPKTEDDNTLENVVCGSVMWFDGDFIDGACSDGEIIFVNAKGCAYQAPLTAGATASLTLVQD